MTRETRAKIVEVLVALVSGFGLWQLTKDQPGLPGALSVLFGIVIGLLVMLVFGLNERSTVLAQKIDIARQQHERILELLSKAVEHSDSDLVDIVRYSMLTLSKENMPKIWRDLLWGVLSEYQATNYIKGIYKHPWASAALAIQRAKTSNDNVHIKKVFIFDTEEEYEQEKKFALEQLEAGILGRYILMNEIKALPLLKERLKRLPSPDFGIFDERRVLVWKLKDRVVMGGELLIGESAVVLHKAFFDDLFLAAKPITK